MGGRKHWALLCPLTFGPVRKTSREPNRAFCEFDSLRTTAGLSQGKFAVAAGGATSQNDNLGLFQNVAVDQSVLNDNDKRLLATKKGAVNADSLLSFVRRAVNDKWIEKGKMRHAK